MGPGLQGRIQEEQAGPQRMQGPLRDSTQVFAEPRGLDPETWIVTELRERAGVSREGKLSSFRVRSSFSASHVHPTATWCGLGGSG